MATRFLKSFLPILMIAVASFSSVAASAPIPQSINNPVYLTNNASQSAGAAQQMAEKSQAVIEKESFPTSGTVVEFYNETLKHYFRTAEPAEVTAILNGAAGPGWIRTFDDFPAWTEGGPRPSTALPVCRFYAAGPNSHFFTSDDAECAQVRLDPGWHYEGIAFYVAAKDSAGACGIDYAPIYRAYNNRFAFNDSNHRFTTSQTVYQQMIAQGWAGEGIVMCVPSPPTTGVAPPAVADYAVYAAQLVHEIVDASTAAQAVEATRQALVSGGLGVSGGAAPSLAARAPAASWSVDNAIAFNLAAEAHDRAASGRMTLAELGQMWAEFDFPFAGSGTAGEQLLGFLRESLLDARAHPSSSAGFTPLFVAEMALRQQPPVDLADPAARPEDLRLSLIEIELLHAMFDRAFEVVATGAGVSRELRAGVPEGLCDALKKFYGEIGTKIASSGVEYVEGQLTDKALLALGLTKAEVELFGKGYGKVFGALSNALKIVKVVQIYAAGQVMVTIEGSNPVRKSPFNGARKLVPVKATAGIPDEDWQNYQQNNSSQAYQDVKSCLGGLGAPIPLDLKDIAAKVGDWRVKWELTSGSPKHALIKTDVNNFNAPGPNGMKLVRSSPIAADATLKVDLKEESQLATLFQGPIVTANVRVRAQVFTSEPPSPELLTQVGSLMGTISALIDLSAGWIQAMIPITSSAVIKVEYHDVPLSIDATMRMAMTYDYPHYRSTPARDRHSISGNWSGKLTRETRIQREEEYEFYSGMGEFAYGGVSTRTRTDENGCTTSYAYASRNGQFQMNVGPGLDATFAILPEAPEQVHLGGGTAAGTAWPSEQLTITVACPGPPPDTQTFTFPFAQEIFVAAAMAMNLEDALLMTEAYPIPGMYLNRGRLLVDGSIEMSYATPVTVSVIVPGAGVVDTSIISQDNLIRLQPTYAPPQ